MKKPAVMCLFLISTATFFADAAPVRMEFMVDGGVCLRLSHAVA
jgi:hypothetical protein